MAWIEGNQNRRQREDVNQEILSLKGFLDENEAKQNLYKFLKDNITFTTSLRFIPFSAYGYQSYV